MTKIPPAKHVVKHGLTLPFGQTVDGCPHTYEMAINLYFRANLKFMLTFGNWSLEVEDNSVLNDSQTEINLECKISDIFLYNNFNAFYKLIILEMTTHAVEKTV